MQQKLSKQFEKCALQHTKSPKESHGGRGGGSIEIEPNVTKLLPYMAITHNNEGVWSHNHALYNGYEICKQLKQILCELWVPAVVDFRKLLQYKVMEETHILSLISTQKTQWFRMEHLFNGELLNDNTLLYSVPLY